MNTNSQVEWRLPIGDSGLLDFALTCLAAPQLDDRLKIQLLRLIANSCAEQDENRQRISSSSTMSLIIEGLNSATDNAATASLIVKFCLPLLYNLCMNYEPAQNVAFSSGLALGLSRLISCTDITLLSGHLDLAVEILAHWTKKSPDPNFLNISVPMSLIEYPIETLQAEGSQDTAMSMLSLGIEYLESVFLENAATDTQVIQKIFTANVRWASYQGDQQSFCEEIGYESRNKLNHDFLSLISDISGRDEFSYKHLTVPFGESPEKSLKDLLLQHLAGTGYPAGCGSSGAAHLQTSACLALGNAARSDEAAIDLVQRQAHASACKILEDPANAQNLLLLHAALGLLKNISVPVVNKSLVGKCLLLETLVQTPGLNANYADGILPWFWSTESAPQLQFEAVALVRSLCTKCPTNVKLLLLHSARKLKLLLDLFSRVDAAPIQLECGRAILQTCKTLYSKNWAIDPNNSGDQIPHATAGTEKNLSNNSLHDIKHSLYTLASKIIDPLRLLITQHKWPALKSECWFVFALMSKDYPQGTYIVRDVLKTVEAATALGEALLPGRGKLLVDILVNNEELATGLASKTSESSLTPVQDVVQCFASENGDDASSTRGNEFSEVPRASTCPTAVQEMETSKDRMVNIDRENTIAVVSELLKNSYDMGLSFRKLEIVLKEATAEVART